LSTRPFHSFSIVQQSGPLYRTAWLIIDKINQDKLETWKSLNSFKFIHYRTVGGRGKVEDSTPCLNIFIIWTGPWECSDWSKTMFYHSTKHRRSIFYCFVCCITSCQHFEKVKSILFEDICDGVLCEAAESFKDKACSPLVITKLHQSVSLCAWEVKKTLNGGSCVLHFPCVLKYLLCFIRQYNTQLRLLYLFQKWYVYI